MHCLQFANSQAESYHSSSALLGGGGNGKELAEYSGGGGGGGKKGEEKLVPVWRQGLTLAHFAAQHERLVWDRGCA